MITRFLGQGIDGKEITIGSYLYSSIKSEKYNSLTIFVAYATKYGIKFIQDAIEERVIKDMSVNIFVGIDDNITDRETLEEILKNDFNGFVIHQVSKSRRAICHLKFYILEGNEYNMIINGSCNLTKSGLFYNMEAVTISSFKKSDSHGMAYLRQVKKYCSQIENSDYVRSVDFEILDKLFVENDRKKFDKENDQDDNVNLDSVFDVAPSKEIELGDIELSNLYRESDIYEFDEKFIEEWDENYNSLINFMENYGRSIVKSEDNNTSLYRFTKTVRYLNETDELPKKYVDKLDQISFTWHDAYRERYRSVWLISFNKIKKFKEENNSLDMSVVSQIKEIKALRRWMRRQKSYKRSGNPKLTQFRIDMLDSIEFDWDYIDKAKRIQLKTDEKWLERYIELIDFGEVHGHVNPSQMSNDEKIKNLGLWVNYQRVNKKRKLLSEERIELLNDIDFIWDMGVHRFKMKVQSLKVYKEKYGDFNVPSNFRGFDSLGSFVYRLKRSTTVKEWKKIELEKIGFNIAETQLERNKDLIQQSWLDNLEKLKRHDESGININMPKTKWEDVKLGKWLYRQKKRYAKKLLNEKQIELLESVGVDWTITSINDQIWDEHLEMAKMYQEEFGDYNVKLSFDKTLSNWIRRQRKNYSKGLLSEDKLSRLKKIKLI